MGTTVSDSGGSYSLVQEGSHLARCVQVIDLGHQENKQFNKVQPKILIGWELPEECEQDEEGDLRPALIWSRLTASLNEKSNLRKLLESWRGRQFSPEELQGFDLKALLGIPCILSVVHSEDGKYANVSAAMPLMKNQQCPPQLTEPIYFNIDHWDDEVFSKFGENLQQSIWNSSEGKVRKRREQDQQAQAVPDDEPFSTPFDQPGPETYDPSEAVEQDADDVPFVWLLPLVGMIGYGLQTLFQV